MSEWILFAVDCLIALTGFILGVLLMYFRYHPGDIARSIWRLRERRITFSIHDSVGMDNKHLWMDMWYWNSEDVEERKKRGLPHKVQVSQASAQTMDALFKTAMKKLEIGERNA